MNSDSDDNSEDVDGDDRDAVMDSSKETKCRDQADDDSKEEEDTEDGLAEGDVTL